MTTIGDLTLNDIGCSTIRVTHQGATVEGLLRAIDFDIDTIDIRAMHGTTVHPRGTVQVSVTLTIGEIGLTGLSRDHSCEVIV